MRKKTFIQGTVILGAAGILVKVIGALYRVPLTALIGPEGIGLYMLAFPIYSYLLVFSTAGIPTAISKLVAESAVRGDENRALRIFRVSRMLLLWVGLISAVLLFVLAEPIAGLVGNAGAAHGIRAVAPALLFVSILSAYRGYLQGYQEMMPTAVSQIVEQVAKLGLGLYFAWRWLGMGVERGAAGALFGVMLSEVAALIVLMYMFFSFERRRRQERPLAYSRQGAGSIVGQILKVAVPITLGASIMPLVGLIDSALVVSRLQSIGYSVEQGTAQLGLLTGVVNTLAFMPTVVTVALQMSLVPAVSQSRAQNDIRMLKLKARGGLKLCVLVALPAALGLFLIAEPMIALLYPTLSVAELSLSVQLLRLSAAGMIFLSVTHAATGILQGAGNIMAPVRHLSLGAAVKLVLNFVLLGIPSVGILGAPIATVCCYFVAAVMSVLSVMKRLDVKFDLVRGLFLPLLATLGMGAAVLLIVRFMGDAAGILLVLAAVAGGVAVYFLLLILTGAVGTQDMVLLPMGQRIAAVLSKLKAPRR
ncbi:MAG: putative polysaccharide biosynthesis protein [Christensenellales bacterium]|jgi:stage V sporulation protein B